MKQRKSTQGQKKPGHSTTSSTNYKVIPIESFIDEAVQLKAKYPHIKNDFFELQQKLKNDPITGNQPLGKDLYKVRMRVTDKNSGESGGARVIVEVKIIDKIVYVLSVYDKSELDSISERQMDKLVRLRQLRFPEKK